MKKLLFSGLFLFFFSSFSVQAQGTNVQSVFIQKIDTQASIIAAADDMIEEVIDQETGETFFIRYTENPRDGELTFKIVLFDATSTTFIDTELYAFNGEDKNKKTHQRPCPNQQDSCIHKQPNLLHNEALPRPKPRRSSRVKLAENF